MNNTTQDNMDSSMKMRTNRAVHTMWYRAVLAVHQCRKDNSPNLTYWEGKRDAYAAVYLMLTGEQP